MVRTPNTRDGLVPDDAEARLTQFIDKFAPAQQSLIRTTRAAMRRRFPGAYELAYDNYNFFVIGYSPTARPSDAVVSIAAAAKGVSVCFIHGAGLRDPSGLLQGAGKQTRFVRLESAAVLDRPELEALLAAAEAASKQPFSVDAPGRLVIRSVSPTQRPRRSAD